MRGHARNRRAQVYLLIRWSEAIERNEGGGPFSIACKDVDPLLLALAGYTNVGY